MANPTHTSRTSALEIRLAAEASRCVKCGLCLPGCPTYQVGGSEAESPRGRIAMAEGLARGQLEASPALTGHLDNCLLCRHCESVCPAGVRFGNLMDDVRALSAPAQKPAHRRLLNLMTRPRTASTLLLAQRLFGWLPDAIGGPRLRQLGRAAGQLSDHPPKPGRYPAIGERSGTVGLFLGCIGRTLQARALQAGVTLLRHAGFDVVVPEQQACCGAMHAHDGDQMQAGRLAQRNLAAFSGLDHVISLASGCGAQMVTATDYVEGGLRHSDLVDFLRHHGQLERMEFKPCPGKVAVHQPCTERNVLKTPPANDLLRAIPGLEVVLLPHNERCCGAAGMHVLTHGELADTLRKPKLDALHQLNPDWLATTNPGCALHLNSGLLAGGANIRVIHPAELLATQLA